MAAAALVVVVVLVVISSSGGGKKSATTGAASASGLAGIPQEGLALGSSSAPVTIDEFADLQCPYCREFAVGALPDLIQKEVKSGKLRIVFHPLAIIGPDSVTAARVAVAAGQQNRLWQFVETFYANQKQENSGYVNDAFLRDVATQSGVNVAKAFAARSTPAVTGALQEAVTAANKLGVSGTPTFFITKKGGSAKPLNVDYTKSAPFITAVEQLAGT
jgi:protein-disulfide isomerase